VQGFGSPVEAFEGFISFLQAAIESYGFEQRTGIKGENTNLFPRHIVEWAYDHASDIDDALACMLDEDGNLNLALIAD
jgi:hypothetical protein